MAYNYQANKLPLQHLIKFLDGNIIESRNLYDECKTLHLAKFNIIETNVPNDLVTSDLSTDQK